jgi:large subunit ribosomal protein L13
VRYSGYPGGQRIASAHDVAQKDKKELFKKAVFGMIRHNKLKSKMINNLILYNGDKK